MLSESISGSMNDLKDKRSKKKTANKTNNPRGRGDTVKDKAKRAIDR
jgi:hypothetical protein